MSENGIEDLTDPEKKAARKEWFWNQCMEQGYMEGYPLRVDNEIGQLFTQLWVCLICGQFISSIVLSTAVVEQVLVHDNQIDPDCPKQRKPLGSVIEKAEESRITGELYT